MEPTVNPPKIELTNANTTALPCSCGNDIFATGRTLRHASKIVLAEAEDKIIYIPVLYCVKCFKKFEAPTPSPIIQ